MQSKLITKKSKLPCSKCEANEPTFKQAYQTRYIIQVYTML